MPRFLLNIPPWTKALWFAILLILICWTVGSTPVFAAETSVRVQIVVHGEDRSGGGHWLVILPGDTPQPITYDQAMTNSLKAEKGFARKAVPPGQYIVAWVQAPALLAVPAPDVLAVAQDHGRDLIWPAFTVRVRPGRSPLVTFDRVGYPPLPPGFVIPHTGEFDLSINTASAAAPQEQALSYRLHVFTGFRGPTDGPAPDGTVVQVSRLPDPRVQRPRPSGPCASAVVQGGLAEVKVTLTDDCPLHERVGITLFFPGQLPITASSQPPLEWRMAQSGEVALINTDVRPIPPRTAGDPDPSPAIKPPVTGSGGLAR